MIICNQTLPAILVATCLLGGCSSAKEQKEDNFFNRRDSSSRTTGNPQYRSVEDGTIAGLPTNPPAHNTSKIRYGNNQLIAFAGGTNISNMQYNAYLETLIRASFPQTNLRFRNLAWDGDTVFEQFRDIGFNNWAENIDSLDTDILFLQFGQMESLNGEAGLDSFFTAYQDLIHAVAQKSRQIILLSPIPFETEKIDRLSLYTAPPAANNGTLAKYAGAIKKLAKANRCRFVDLFHAFQQPANSPFTTNGIHLNDEGHRMAAHTIMKELGTPREYDNTLEPVRQAVLAKNGIWFSYWRPANWAFLKGDRNQVEFSRDWKNYEKRIFLEEMEEFKPILAEAENRIQQTLKTIAR